MDIHTEVFSLTRMEDPDRFVVHCMFSHGHQSIDNLEDSCMLSCLCTHRVDQNLGKQWLSSQLADFQVVGLLDVGLDISLLKQNQTKLFNIDRLKKPKGSRTVCKGKTATGFTGSWPSASRPSGWGSLWSGQQLSIVYAAMKQDIWGIWMKVPTWNCILMYKVIKKQPQMVSKESTTPITWLYKKLWAFV